jgi:FKBP-type peptidyl-prolyl cis-trans isomerase (trigger factor)
VTLGEYKKEIAGALRADSIIIPGKEKDETQTAESIRAKKEGIVIKTLLSNIKITIPKILIEEEADSRLSSLLSRLEKLGLALENYLASIGKKAEDLRADYANQAREAIALDLILSKVAEAEGIKVGEKEIDAALGMSQVAGKAASENPEEIESRKRLLESILKRRSALDFLINLD